MNGTAEAPLLQPHNLEAEESVLGAMMVSEAAIDPVVVEVRLASGGLLPGPPRDDLRRDPRALRALRAGRRADRRPSCCAARASSRRSAAGRSSPALASSTPVPGNAGHYAQIVKQNSMLRRLLGAAQRIEQSVHTREGEPQELVEQAEKLLFNVARAEQAGDFSSIARHPRPRDRAAREARQRRDADDRHAVGLPQARRHDRRLPARQPDRDRRPPGDGQVEPRLQHRRERRLEGEAAGRLLLARDVGDRARAPLHRLARPDLLRPPPQGTGDEGVDDGAACLQRARRGAAVDRRLLRPEPARPAGQVPAPRTRPRAASGW